MSEERINFQHALEDRTVAHRWIERYCVIVPGIGKYNLWLRPECLGHTVLAMGWTLTFREALDRLVKVHGIENVLTHEMKQEAQKCGLAKTSVGDAAKLILERYHVSEPVFEDLQFFQNRAVFGRARWDLLEWATSLPEVAYLAKVHGRKLGQALLDRVRGSRRPVAWESGLLGQPWRKKQPGF